MPEMLFDIVWPDQREERCYSPSLVIKDHLAPGKSYPLGEFLTLSREALTTASDRVKAKYGFACSRALGQLARIEAEAARHADKPGAAVLVKAFHDGEQP